MNILTGAIISNSDIIKNYKSCREKAEEFGRVFVLKNNHPDAVLFSIEEYERFSVFIEYLENLQTSDISKLLESLPKAGTKNQISSLLKSREKFVKRG